MIVKIIKFWNLLPKNRRHQFLYLIIIMIGSSIAEMISIGAIVPFLSLILDPNTAHLKLNYLWSENFFSYIGRENIVLVATLFFILSIVVSGFLRLLVSAMNLRVAYVVGSEISQKMFELTLYQQYSVHLSRNSSEIINGIMGKSGVAINCITNVLNIITSLFILIGIISAILYIDAKVALIAFVGFSFIYAVVAMATKSHLNKYSLNISTKSSIALQALQEGLGGIRDIILAGTQKYFLGVFAIADRDCKIDQGKVYFIGTSPRYVIEALAMLFLVMLAYGLSVYEEGGVVGAVPILAGITLGAQRLLPVLQQIYSSWTFIRGASDSIDGAIELLSQPVNSYEFGDDEVKKLEFRRKIVLSNVTFRYAISNRDVLEEINIVIKKGDRVGIVGKTGAGKSTLADIIMSLLHPVEGKILVDDVIIDCKNRREWQKNISHVPQSIYLSDASVLENIAFGVPPKDIDFNKVMQAANDAQIYSDILEFPAQFDTKVGERGVRLSGGQRQRIGIARALYGGQSVIVLDEATSALDGLTEKSFMDVLKNLGEDKTIIIVAHRLSTLEFCNVILNVNDKKVVEQRS